ncbi:MAG: cupin domain-containing protein [Cyanobacteria bacterium P01_C01_bin.69]
MKRLNANFDERVALHAADIPWQASPMAGVERRMLDRLGGEVARATTIVRYAPNSQFSPHVHTGGEEFLVLEGVFQDEYGDFPAGSYIRNPPESSHTPGSAPGCTILVKLWQFDLCDRIQIRLDTNKMSFIPNTDNPAVQSMPLFHDAHEDVRLEKWTANARLDLEMPGGAEIFVMEGSFMERGETFLTQSWLRLPKAAATQISVGADGAKVWVKRGHLAQPPQPPQSLRTV